MEGPLWGGGNNGGGVWSQKLIATGLGNLCVWLEIGGLQEGRRASVESVLQWKSVEH